MKRAIRGPYREESRQETIPNCPYSLRIDSRLAQVRCCHTEDIRNAGHPGLPAVVVNSPPKVLRPPSIQPWR